MNFPFSWSRTQWVCHPRCLHNMVKDKRKLKFRANYVDTWFKSNDVIISDKRRKEYIEYDQTYHSSFLIFKNLYDLQSASCFTHLSSINLRYKPSIYFPSISDHSVLVCKLGRACNHSSIPNCFKLLYKKQKTHVPKQKQKMIYTISN